jgi:hypothetical protein
MIICFRILSRSLFTTIQSFNAKQSKLSTALLNKPQITNFMGLSLSSEAGNCAATQELPSICQNPKVHYRGPYPEPD